MRRKQLQRVEHLAVFDASIIDEEDQILNPGLLQTSNTFCHKLWGAEDRHMLRHGIIVGIHTACKAAPVFFEIVRQEFYLVVGRCADFLARPFAT